MEGAGELDTYRTLPAAQSKVLRVGDEIAIVI
jgi:hypothetical protein